MAFSAIFFHNGGRIAQIDRILTENHRENNLRLDVVEEFGQTYAKPFGNNFEVDETNIAFAGFNFRNIAAIKAQIFGKLILCPTVVFTQGADSAAQAGFDIATHESIIACRL